MLHSDLSQVENKLYCGAMRFFHLASIVLPILLPQASAAPSGDGISQRQASTFAGYLISTFSDVNPAVQFYLSVGNNPGSYVFSNHGQAVLKSTVGQKAVRDIYLTSNAARNKWFIIATGRQYPLP